MFGWLNGQLGSKKEQDINKQNLCVACEEYPSQRTREGIDDYCMPCLMQLWRTGMPRKRNQPERSKREDSQKCEMRCSEHCGNTVSGK